MNQKHSYPIPLRIIGSIRKRSLAYGCVQKLVIFRPPQKFFYQNNNSPLPPVRRGGLFQKGMQPIESAAIFPYRITSSNRFQFTLCRQYAFQSFRSYLSSRSFKRFWTSARLRRTPAHPSSFKATAENRVCVLFHPTAAYH